MAAGIAAAVLTVSPAFAESNNNVPTPRLEPDNTAKQGTEYYKKNQGLTAY